MRRSFPKSGLEWTEIKEQLSESKKDDVDWRGGKITGLVYFAGDDVLRVAHDAYTMFPVENAVHPDAHPSLERLESEIIDMTLDMLHGGESATGSMSTGGTESNFLAVKTARDWARDNRPTKGTPEMVVPASAHPSFYRAAQIMDLKITVVPLGPDYRADVDAMASAISDDTFMIIGSAPPYPHGVMDCIRDLGQLALDKGLWLHVDSCLGGFLAPFVKKLGYPIQDFDFAVPGVTSISADIHKNGYSAKGASTVTYRDAQYFKYQGFEFDAWARGRYATQTFTGSRAGGAVSSAWAVMNYLGEEGYMRVARQLMQTRDTLMEGVRGMDGLEINGKPELSIFTYSAQGFDIFAVADALSDAGWYVSRLQDPPGIHLMLSLVQAPVVEEYLSDLAQSVQGARAGQVTSRGAKIEY